MSSLTFARPPPLVPPTLAQMQNPTSQETGRMQIQEQDPSSPTSPLSPLSPLPPHSPIDQDRASPSDLSFLAGVANRRGTAHGPSISLLQQAHAQHADKATHNQLESGGTPNNTPSPRPAARVAAAPIRSPLSPHSPLAQGFNSNGNGPLPMAASLDMRGGATPVNTPAHRPPPAGRLSMASPLAQANANGASHAPGRVSGGLDHMHIPSSLSTPLGGTAQVQPLNAATAMRGRAIGVGIGIGGAGGGSGHNAGGNAQALNMQAQGGFTPGNTPSSLERVSRRLANNLMVGGKESGVTHQIAPSYERRFNAGLLDLNNKLATQPEHSESSQTESSAPFGGQAYGNSLTNNSWPTRFDADSNMSVASPSLF